MQRPNSNNSPQNPSSKDEETLEQYIARKLTAAGLDEKIQTTIQKCKDQDIVNVKSLQKLSYSRLRECGFTVGIANELVIQDPTTADRTIENKGSMVSLDSFHELAQKFALLELRQIETTEQAIPNSDTSEMLQKLFPPLIVKKKFTGVNSLFDCLCYQLGDQTLNLRNIAVEAIKKNQDLFEEFIKPHPIRKYYQQMLQSELPADDIVLQALSNELKINILILESKSPHQIKHVAPSTHSKTCIMIARVQDDMFAVQVSTGRLADLNKYLYVHEASAELQWTLEIKKKWKVDQDGLNDLYQLSVGFILDIENYISNNLNSNIVRKYEVEWKKLKSDFSTIIDASKIPSSAEPGLFQQVITNASTFSRTQRSQMYWAGCVYHYRNLTKHINKGGTELGLTGTVLSHMYDSFWTRYCEDGETDFEIIWHRNKETESFLGNVPKHWSFFNDAIIQVPAILKGVHGPVVMAVFEDKKDSSKQNEDRVKLAETSRYVFDSIRSKYPFLDDTQLERILIPAVHTAGNIVDFYLLKWSGKEENCYPFYHVVTYDTTQFEQYIAACQRMWNILEIIKKNVDIIREVHSKPELKDHRYVERVHRSKPPSSSKKCSSHKLSGGSNSTTNTPVKPKGNNNNNTQEDSVEWKQVQQYLVDNGHTILNTITLGDFEAVFAGFETRQKQIIKITNNTHELSILQKIHGKHHIIKLLRHFQITLTGHSTLTAVVLPFIQDVHVTSESQLKIFAAHLIEAMVFLHKSGIYHRDIKRGNVIFDGKNLQLIDFDLAYMMNNPKRPKGAVGTTGYMAPEVLEGLESGFPADTWSAGIVIIEEFYWWKRGEVGSLFVRQRNIEEILQSLDNLCFTQNLRDMYAMVQEMVKRDPQNRITDDEIVKCPFIAGAQQKNPYQQDKENLPQNQTQKKAKIEVYNDSLVY